MKSVVGGVRAAFVGCARVALGVVRHAFSVTDGLRQVEGRSSGARGCRGRSVTSKAAIARVVVARRALQLTGGLGICFRWKDGDAFDVEIVDYH